MASDPRLNLSAFAQINVGPVSISIGSGADSCSSNIEQNLLSGTSANLAASLQLPGNVGAFANLQLGQGGGVVGAGLTNLAAISDSIRVNGPPTASNPQGLPVSTDPNAGSEFVLQQVGLSTQSLNVAASVNTEVAQNAHIQAGAVFNQVQSGSFTNADIPSVFASFQNAHTLISAVYSPSGAVSPAGSQFGSFCGAKPYAIDLIRFAPKYKFLFVVQFEFHPWFQEILKSIDPAFVIKTSTRPQVEFEYQDVNMYNFRTKVPAKTMYQPMTMKFYDDDYNNAFQLYTTYMKLMSPISNIDIESQSIDPLDAYDNVGGGMGFDQNALKIQSGWSHTVGQGYAASLGPYGDIPQGGTGNDNPTGSNIRNILRRITLFQVYRQGLLMNVFHFYNPKITTMTLDDLDMAMSGEGNEISLTFSYDSVFIIPGYNINANSGGPNYDLPNMTSDGIYPFGVVPGTLPQSLTNTLKDGVGSGLSSGQDNMLANSAAGPTSSLFASIPLSVSGFVRSGPVTIGGSSLVNLPIPPLLTGGGVSTATSIQGNTPGNLSQVTSSNTVTQDPVTGTSPQSADNSGNIGNVMGQAANATNAASAAAAAANPTTLAQSVGVQQTQQSTDGGVQSASSGDSTSFNSGATGDTAGG